MKDKMNSEKSKFEREEMRDKYAAMDSVVRAEARSGPLSVVKNIEFGLS